MNKTTKWIDGLVAAWAFFFTIVSLGSAISLALTNVDWVEISTQSKFLVIVAIVVNWGNTMMAFISKSATKLEKGESPINGGTDFFKKEDATTAIAVEKKTP